MLGEGIALVSGVSCQTLVDKYSASSFGLESENSICPSEFLTAGGCGV